MSEGKGFRALTRRSFLKATGALAAATAVTGSLASCAPDGALEEGAAAEETVTTTICRSNCSQGCLFNVYAREGKVVRLEPKAYETDLYRGCCLRGLSIQERTYSPKRVMYPLRRTGERGEDKWERISWDEAIAEVAGKFTDVQERYGKQALLVSRCSGNACSLNGSGGMVNRFANATQATLHGYSIDQAFEYSAFRTLGTFCTNETADAVNARTIVIWGANLAWASPQTWRCFMNAHDHGTKIVVIDPIFSASAARADKYIPVKPGMDTLIALALINKVIREKTYDSVFCRTRSSAPFLVDRATGKLLKRGGEYLVWDASAKAAVPADSCKSPALFGSFTVDGAKVDTVFTLLKERVTEFTEERAVEQAGISEADFAFLYRCYVQEGPVWLAGMYGIDHYWNGHHWSYAASVLSAITGNVGKHGASYGSLWNTGMNAGLGDITSVEGKSVSGDMVPNAVRDVVKTGTYQGEDYPIKALLISNENTISNAPDQREMLDEILPKIEFVVSMDIEFTDSARYADIILPVSYWLEQEDLRINNGNPYIAISEKAIDNLYESKTDHEIFTLLAQAMGLEADLPERTPQEWLSDVMASDDMKARGISYERLQEEKAIRVVGSEDEPFVTNAESFATPSGRAELYCENPEPRYDFGQDWKGYVERERMPYWEETLELSDEGLAQKYPLQFLQVHSRWRTHTQWFGTEALKELDPEPLIYLSANDAGARGLSDGDVVKCFNGRGSMTVRCTVHNGLQDGIAWMAKGWQRDQFIDGCYQELTHTKVHPMAVNYNFYDVRIEVEKVA